jgi:hypothetical protein
MLNGGELAVLYCFVFLFFAAAGPGAWSLDGLLRRKPARVHAAREGARSWAAVRIASLPCSISSRSIGGCCRSCSR